MYENTEITEITQITQFDVEPADVFEDETSEDAWSWANSDDEIPW